MASGIDQRREPRVAFSGFVRLRGLGEEQSVEAEIRNLSATGMFVASKRVPQPGAAVFCRVVIGNDRRIIKGKVAWASPGGSAEPPGAGIEFVDITKKDSEVLRHVVDANAHDTDVVGPTPEVVSIVDSDNLGRVEVSFEGLPTPVNARARITPEGIVLTTKLPFLRVGSEVRVSYATPNDGVLLRQLKQGRLDGVSLGSTGADGVPRLLVELTVPQGDDLSAKAPVPTETSDYDTEPQGLTLPMSAAPFVAKNPASAVQMADSDAWVGPPQELTDPDITPVPGQVTVEAGPQIEIDIQSAPQTSVAGSMSFSSPPARVAPQESIELHMTPMPQALAPLLVEPPASEPTMRVELAGNVDFLLDQNAAPSALQSSWKIIVVAALAAAVAALVAFGGDELETGSAKVASSDPIVAPPKHEVPANEGIRIERLPAVAGAVPAPKVVPPPSPVKTSEAWRPISDPSWPFTVMAEGNTTKIFIPFGGEQTGSRVYDIAAPKGVVALLPHGTIEGKFGKYRVRQAGIAQVWIEARETGLHARILFGTIVQSHEATLEKTGLRVVATIRSE